MTERSLLLGGASRGLGLALADEFLRRGWRVVATERRPSALRERVAGADGRLQVEKLDIVGVSEVEGLRAKLSSRRFDIVFVNAGVANGPGETFSATSDGEFTRVMLTNALAPLRFLEAFADLVAPGGVQGVMSSGLGSVTLNTNGGWEVYRASKAALNMLMRSYAARPESRGRGFVVMTPGWVRTDMGGPHAKLGVEESIPRVADVLTAQLGKPGLQYLSYEGQTVPW